MNELQKRRQKEDGKKALLWPDMDGFKKRYHRAARVVGFEMLQLRPYCHRHGGASRDRLHGQRSLNEVQRRGRRGSQNSVKVYEKHGRVLEILKHLLHDVTEFGGFCRKNFDVLCHNKLVLRPLRTSS